MLNIICPLTNTSVQLISQVNKEGILDPICLPASPKPRRNAVRRKSLAEERHRLSDPPVEPPFGCVVGHILSCGLLSTMQMN
jgi:serine carboxypeptidase-like clade 1